MKTPVVLLTIHLLLGLVQAEGPRRLVPLPGVQPEPVADDSITQAEIDKPAPPQRKPVDLREGWFLGKIEPTLIDRAAREATLELVIYLDSDPLQRSIDDVKQPHLAEIERLSAEVKEIIDRYRPQGTFTREQENALVPILDQMIPEVEQNRKRELNTEIDRRLTEMRGDVHRELRLRVLEVQDEVAARIAELGGRVEGRSAISNALRATVPGDALLALAGHPRITAIVPRPVNGPRLDVSTNSTGFSNWYSNGYDGGIYDAGLVDNTGMQQNHPAFSGISIYDDGSQDWDPDTHATHVAGIIAGNDATWRGAAYGLDKLFFGNANRDWNAFEDLMDSGVTGAGDAPEVLNHSWGSSGVVNSEYDSEVAFFDSFVTHYDTTIAQAVGNTGASGLWSTHALGTPENAYNVISISNMNDKNTSSRSDDRRASNSGYGPTEGGRKKPDLAAPGTNIISTNSAWAYNGLCNPGILGCGALDPFGNWCGADFCTDSGTSMAAPHVAGAIVLLSEAGISHPREQKAILINTADAWTSGGTYSDSNDGSVSGSHWDRVYGWGYLNMTNAYAHRSDVISGSVVPRNNNATEDDYKLYRGTMTANEKATLVWEKRNNHNGGTVSSGSRYDLSDLDLYLYNEATGTEVDYSDSTPDNVEQVAAGSTISAIVKVAAFSSSFDGGVASEPFALATQENFVSESFPDSFGAFGTWPGTMTPGTQESFSAHYFNEGSIASHSNLIDLQALPAGWSLISGADTQNVGSAPMQGNTGTATWTLQARAADTTPPPTVTWATEPVGVSTSQLEMNLNSSTDTHGPVEYQIGYLNYNGAAGGNSRDWGTSTFHSDSGLDTNQYYCYRARARDTLPVTEYIPFTHRHNSYGESYSGGVVSFPVQLDETRNTNDYNVNLCAYTHIESASQVSLVQALATSIEVKATATLSGLDRGSSGLFTWNHSNATQSGWQQHNNGWVSAGLTPNTSHTFQILARNGDGIGSVITPTRAIYTLAAQPAVGSLTSTENSVTASWGANGNPAGTEYYVLNNQTAANSGWITSTSWTDVGLPCGSSYDYFVTARNAQVAITPYTYLGNKLVGNDSDSDGAADCVDTDDDNDGVEDAGDCRPLLATLWSTPGQVFDLTASHGSGPGATTTFSWGAPTAPGTTQPLEYDLLSSLASNQWDSGSASCVESDGGDLTADHTGDPANGEVIYFLARAKNGCGDGAMRSYTGPVSECANCAHPICEVGIALEATCDDCAAQICAVDSWCCNNEWDDLCVDQVATVCGETCL